MKAWPTIRALLLGAVLVVGLVDGCPVPSQRNLDEDWPRALVPFGQKLASTRAFLLTPFAFIGEGLSIRQRWSLFSSADRTRFRMWIEARRGQEDWRLLFRPHDPAHTYQADAIEYRRLRGAWNLYHRGPSPGYPAFVDWIARTIFLDPALHFDTVRVRMETIDVSPGTASSAAGKSEFQHELSRERQTLLAAPSAAPITVPSASPITAPKP